MTNTQQTILNIAVNLGRLSRWAQEKRSGRIKQFIKDTENYVVELDSAQFSPKFRKTFLLFKKQFEVLKKRRVDINWAEDALTWANILTHRAKLA